MEIRKMDGTVLGHVDEDNVYVEAIVTGITLATGGTACKCKRKDPSKWDVRSDGTCICRSCHRNAANITTDIQYHY
jgi:hypothetical protein